MKKLLLIAGPCLIENDDVVSFTICGLIKEICGELGIDFIFKASFRKANRTALGSFTGIGDIQALEVIKEIGKVHKVRTITDVHEVKDIEMVSTYVDCLQIPAFLCRQTDLLVEAGKTEKLVLIKKGQFMHPQDMQYAFAKVIRGRGNINNIWLCERGITHGYDDLIVDALSMERLRVMSPFNVIMDCTHPLQKGEFAGNPIMIKALALSAVVTGADGLFIETHTNPKSAKSDANCMLDIKHLEGILRKVVVVKKVVTEGVPFITKTN